MNTPRIPVALVEDRPDILDYLRELLADSEQFDCAQTYKSVEDALVFLPQKQPRIVIVDIGFPAGRKNGIECVRLLKPQMPESLFIMYTVFEETDKIFESLKAGASGYLLKDAPGAKILAALVDLIEGGAPMSGSIARKVIEYFQKPPAPNRRFAALSPREQEIVHLLARGRLYKEIADELGIREGTVKVHIHNIYEKLHVSNSREAIDSVFGNNPDA